MKGESSDKPEKDGFPLRYLITYKKRGKKEALDSKKRPLEILGDEETNKELLVTPHKKVDRKSNGVNGDSSVVEKSSVSLRKRKPVVYTEVEVEEDEFEVLGSGVGVLEYKEDDLVGSKKMNKEIENGRGNGRKRSKSGKENRGIDASDDIKPDAVEDKVFIPAGKSKEQLKVWCKDQVKAEGEGVDSLDRNKKPDIPEKFNNDAKDSKSPVSSASSTGRRTRSSVKLEQKLKNPIPPKVTVKSESPKGFPAKEKRKGHHLTKVKKNSSLQAGSENVGACVKAKKEKGKAISTTEKDLSSELPKKKMGKLNMEKEVIRDQIRKMLDSAGWKIEYRLRMSLTQVHREYYDAVYVDLKGGTYWSIVKAYNALEKFCENQNDDRYASDFSFTPIPEGTLDKLTRRTRGKIKREKMIKGEAESGNMEVKRTTRKVTAKKKHLQKSKGGSMNKEKLNNLIKQDRKLLKMRMKKKGFKPNRKNGIKRSTSTNSSDEDGNGELNPSEVPSDAHRRGRKSKSQRGYTLLARKPDKGANSTGEQFIAYDGKRTVLSWLIDLEVLSPGVKVKYINERDTQAFAEGLITRDGINCCCCNEIFSISDFETHAGSELRDPWQNTYVETGISLYQSQIDAWNKQEESERSGFHCIDTTTGDPNDDVCGICGDGGDLICCDTCPSTFHQGCLGIQALPKGDWQCLNCSCKFCAVVGCNDGKEDGAITSKLLTCRLCDEKYHESCIPQRDAVPVALDNVYASFCESKCRELFEQLQKLLGVKHEMEGGFSWTMIQRSDLDSDSDSSLCGLSQKVECNSKLALALSVLDECFMPNVEERSGINLIHNVVYNCGSNFKRLNYSGFYTFLLEKGDDIISAATIRLHGAKFAEMPFIGTRYIYRRQGMCRRLLNAIESSLSSLNVEKLIIPAVSDLRDTWTTVFGFSPLEESYKNEFKFSNMIVFPGVDLLEKLPLKHSSQSPVASPLMNCSGEFKLPASIKGAADDAQNVDGVDDQSFALETSPNGSDLKDIKLKGDDDIPAEVTVNCDTTRVSCANGIAGKVFQPKTGLQEPGNH